MGRGSFWIAATSLAISIFPIIGPRDASAQAPLIGLECFKKLHETAALTRDGKVRFALHSITVPYGGNRRADTILDIEPAFLDLKFFQCAPRIAPGGAIQVNGLSVAIPAAPSSSKSLTLGFQDMAPQALQNFEKKAAKNNWWISRPPQFGMRRYQTVTKVIDGRIMPDAHFLGATYTGNSDSGHFVRIKCLDYDVAKSPFCHFEEEVMDDVLMSFMIPSSEISDWKRFGAAGEAFFYSHIEKAG